MFLPHSQLLDSICWCLVRCGGRSWPSLYKAQRLVRMKTAVILSGSSLNDVVLSTPSLLKCLLVVYIFSVFLQCNRFWLLFFCFIFPAEGLENVPV